MADQPEMPPADWNLGDWESALTIKVGQAYACRECENLVMVTRGGVGIIQLHCCGKPMECVGPGTVQEEGDEE
jgi:hypothetical protein